MLYFFNGYFIYKSTLQHPFVAFTVIYSIRLFLLHQTTPMHFLIIIFPVWQIQRRKMPTNVEETMCMGSWCSLLLNHCLGPVGLDQNTWQNQWNGRTEQLGLKSEGLHHHVATTPQLRCPAHPAELMMWGYSPVVCSHLFPPFHKITTVSLQPIQTLWFVLGNGAEPNPPYTNIPEPWIACPKRHSVLLAINTTDCSKPAPDVARSQLET